MTELPSAEELADTIKSLAKYDAEGNPGWPEVRQRIAERLLEDRRAVLEAAAEIPQPEPRLPGTPNPRGLVCVGYRQAWKDYADKIRELMEQ